jgi:four helix bundle protein
MIRDVTDLDVYNLALGLLENVYKIATQLPPDHRTLRYQVVEASQKIAPQIAEGFGKKKSPREFCRFLSMALGSSDEIITHLRQIKIVAVTFRRISPDDCDTLIEEYKLLSKKINRLLSVWQKFT